MIDKVLFSQLDAVLEELGFQKHVVPSSHVYYTLANSDTKLLLRLHEPDDLVPTYNLLATRVELDNQGVIEASEFEEMLRSATEGKRKRRKKV